MPSPIAETREQAAAIAEVCRRNVGALADSLKFCFDRRFRVEVGGLHEWDPASAPGLLAGPGLILTIEAAGQALLALVPESLPLPAWYGTPGLSESARLETLALEWSINLLPEDVPATRSGSRAVANLLDEAERAAPARDASALELSAQLLGAGGQPDPAAPAMPVLVIWPAAASTGRSVAAEPPVVPAESVRPFAAPALSDLTTSRARRRLLNLPVTISVRLAEKRIEMGQLLSITPGALITFNKPCEDLLDLYVNNRPYCRGEAVKIGEKFGLKVNELPLKPPA